MKLAIVGSRRYPDLEKVRRFVRSLPRDTFIISGGAVGVDKEAVAEALSLGMAGTVFEAKWHQYGKQAGMMRNRDIVNAADEIVAFWDGKSKGTANTIQQAKNMLKKVTVVGPADPLPGDRVAMFAKESKAEQDPIFDEAKAKYERQMLADWESGFTRHLYTEIHKTEWLTWNTKTHQYEPIPGAVERLRTQFLRQKERG